ncbi:ORF1a [Alphamesonivirus daknongense]|uniref:ORF1a n=1 Tax=Alphamesonivirus daknongense TaxID=1945561 RepID=M4JYR4_9NIDO|nr:ORF1a [Alphamesonivirus 3]AGE00061.1 ORF1a [Alphamesonivirus 3]
MTYHDYAAYDNVVLQRDHITNTQTFYINMLTYWTPLSILSVFCIYLLKRFMPNPLSGPVNDNTLKTLIQRIHYFFTRKYYYYQVPVYARDESRQNVFLTPDYARIDRVNLTEFCTRCNLYGHNTQSAKHVNTIDALILANVCKIRKFNKDLKQVQAYTVHNIKAFEHNPKLFTEIFGTPVSIIPSRFALAPKSTLATLKPKSTNLGQIYINDTIEHPHIGFFAYENQEQLNDLIAQLSLVLDHLMVYTDLPIPDVPTMQLYKDSSLLHFTNNTNLLCAFTSYQKEARTNWLFKEVKSTKVDDEDEHNLEKQEIQLKPQTNLLKYKTSKIGKSKARLPAEESTTENPQGKQTKIGVNPVRVAFGPSFMTLLCIFALVQTSFSKICTEYHNTNEDGIPCQLVNNLTNTKYMAFYNYEQVKKPCFSLDGNNYEPLVRLSMQTTDLNLNNIIKPQPIDEYLLKAFYGLLPLNTFVLSTLETKTDLQILAEVYNINTTDNSKIVYNTPNTIRSDYVGKILQLSDKVTFDCEAPTCILFSGLNFNASALDIKITNHLTRRIEHSTTGRPLIISPECKQICSCSMQSTVKQEPEVINPSQDFYTKLRYFQQYELRMYDDLMSGVLQYNNYKLERHMYKNSYCLSTDTKTNHCIYDPTLFNTTVVKNANGNYLECGVNHKFCEDFQLEFAAVEYIPEIQPKTTDVCEPLFNYLKSSDLTSDAISIIQIITQATKEKLPANQITFALNGTLRDLQPLATYMQNCVDANNIVKTTSGSELDLYTDRNSLMEHLQTIYSNTNIILVNDVQDLDCNKATAFFSFIDPYIDIPTYPHTLTLFTQQVKLFNVSSLQYLTDYYQNCIVTNEWNTPFAVRMTENIITISTVFDDSNEIPIETPLESQILNTLNYYTTYFSQVFYTKQTTYTDLFTATYETLKQQLTTRVHNVVDSFTTMTEKFEQHYPLRNDFYHQTLRAFDLGRFCDFLHHTDTLSLYNDCVSDQLQPISVINLRYGLDSNAYSTHDIDLPINKQSLYSLTQATGYIYRGQKHLFYRPLFTNANQYVLTVREDYLEYCKTSTIPVPAFTPETTLTCFPYITGAQSIDHFIAEIGPFLILYTAALTIIVLAAVQIRENKYIMFIKMCIIFVYAFGPRILTPAFPGSFILSWLYNHIPFVASTSYGVLLMLSILLTVTIDFVSFVTTYSKRTPEQLRTCVLHFVALVFEVLATFYYILLPYLFTGYGILMLIITTYVAHIYRRSQLPNYRRSSVTMATAHADWVKYRESTREKTDEAAKSSLRRVMNMYIGDATSDKLLESVYLAACYTNTVLAPTFNPRHTLHIPRCSNSVFCSTASEVMNHSSNDSNMSTTIRNKSALSNPSIPYIALPLPVSINPLITYDSVSSLRGSVVNGYIYILRHLFGSNQKDFDSHYANGKGLNKCKNLERSKYDIDNAELIGTLIRIPLVDPKSVPDVKIHPKPLSYTGPVTLYLSRYDSETAKDVLCVHTGFIAEGHHDIRTVFGDCGGMLFDPRGQLLGLHCAGSADVSFLNCTTGTPNIWTSYKIQHPSEIMITLDNGINLPQPEDYDFYTAKICYQHPLRDVRATLQTLQYLTNQGNTKLPYDPQLLADFNITAEQYNQHGYYIDYKNFIQNFIKYTNTLINSRSFEMSIKYGVANLQTNLTNQSETQLAINNPIAKLATDYTYLLDLLYIIIYMLSNRSPLHIICALVSMIIIFIKMDKRIKVTLLSLCYAIPLFYYRIYIGLICIPLRLTALPAFTKPLTALNVYRNKNLKLAKTLATELGTSKNLCIQLATLLKCIKPYPAFSELEQVVNNVDDLMAKWDQTHDAEAVLKQNIDEIYKLYPILFIVFEQVEKYDDQIKLIMSYINDTGNFDLNGFEINYDENEHTTKIIDPALDNLQMELVEKQDCLVTLRNMNSEFDISSIQSANIGELVRYLIVSSTPETLNRELLTQATEALVQHITTLRNSNDHSENLIPLLSEIYKHKDLLTSSYLTAHAKDKNFVMNSLVRVIALFNKQINLQVQQATIEAKKVERARMAESKTIIEQNNRIRKIQRQNQNIASAIVHMVHACFANRFMLQNEARKITKALAGTNVEFELTEAESDYYYQGRVKNTVMNNQAITTNFTTLSTVLWTGNGYQKLPSMCGSEEFVCTLPHKHGYFNCTMQIKDAWYAHVDACERCRTYYKNNRHPRCGAIYPADLKRYATLSNFVSRYHSCPQCLPCTQCLSIRESTCSINCYHPSDNSVIINQAYLTPLNIKPDSLEYTFIDKTIGDVNAVYNGRIWLMRRSIPISPPPARYRHITNLKLKQADPEGYYYISDVCPTDIAILNAMINQIQLKLQDCATMSNESLTLIDTQTQINSTIFCKPVNDNMLDELKENHIYLLILKLQPQDEHLYIAMENYLSKLNPSIHICLIIHNEIPSNHLSLYINCMQVWRHSINHDNPESLSESVNKMTINTDFQNGHVH